jgi:hypothetical protein
MVTKMVSTESGLRRARIPDRTRVRPAVGTAWGAVPLVVLLLMVPGALGSSVVVMTAPYSSVTVSPANGYSTVSCAHATVANKAYFHGGSGFGGFADRAAARYCSGPTSSSGWSDGSFTAMVPIHLSHSSASVIAAVVVRAWVSATLSLGKCTITNPNSTSQFCSLAASAAIHGFVWVEDTTAGSAWYPSTYWGGISRTSYSDTSCYQGSCSSSQSQTLGPSQTTNSTRWSINITHANPKDHFALIVEYYGYASVSWSVSGASLVGGIASAVVNAATRGNGIDLASITIS